MLDNPSARFVLYSPLLNGPAKRLTETLEGPFSRSQWETINTPERLKGRLEAQSGRLCAVVLVAPTRDVLDRIISLKPLFHGLAVIMVLPDNEHETMARAHILRPRFYTYIDDGFEEIPEVLKRILDRHCATKSPAGNVNRP